MRASAKHRLIWVCAIVLVAGIASACSVGSNDPDPTSTADPAPPTTVSEPTEPPATATAANTATSTATSVPPTPTRTATPSPTATATPVPKVQIGPITPLDPAVVTNFTLTTDLQLRGVPNQPDFLMSLLILQAQPNHYYLRSTTGDSGIESWLVEGTTYLTQADGSVAQLPDGSDTALFSPSLLVQTIPTLNPETVGVDLGTEEVNGRQTTHFQIDSEDLLRSTVWLPNDGSSDIEGVLDIWIDNETRLVIRRLADVRWENSDGSEGAFVTTYDVTNITTTEPVTAPG